MPTPLDLWLIAALGFLGSFGHCIGMCGPLTAAIALSLQEVDSSGQIQAWKASFWFHAWLNMGRLLSYALVGAGIGALGSVVFAGGQMAGVGSDLRRMISMLTGTLLIWFGLTQAKPGFLPTLPFLHPDRQATLHDRLTRAMMSLASGHSSGQLPGPQAIWLPLLLGSLWGLIPCGFLYAGQLRAAETQNWLGGASIMLAFGAGTVPAMLTMGVATSLLSRDRRSQLFRIGGWLTVVIGLLLLLRTGDVMSDYSGQGALICLILALIARPISLLWAAPLRYRRLLGVGAFVLSLLHTLHMISHSWNWQFQAVSFMLRSHQLGILLGVISLLLLLPAALTSFDRAQKRLGNRWRKLHLLGVPALLLAAAHAIIIGASYWGPMVITWQNQARVAGLFAVVVMVLGVRSPRIWSVLSLSTYYVAPQSNRQSRSLSADHNCHPDGLPAQSDAAQPDAAQSASAQSDASQSDASPSESSQPESSQSISE